ncbi:hypothetical protein [Paenibacillus taichungensis]
MNDSNFTNNLNKARFR